MVVIDLFSGAGGLTEGFIRQGFDIVAHIEKDRWACETLKTRIIYHYLKEKNDLQLYHNYLKDIKDYRRIEENRQPIYCKYPELQEKLKYEVLNKSFGDPTVEKDATGIDEMITLIEESMKYKGHQGVQLIIGGPPCQAYSLVGRGRMKEAVEVDNRNYLFRYYKDIVNHFRPNMFVFENVPGILTAKKGEIYPAIIEEFREIGYTLLSGNSQNPRDNILDALDFGVHQSRKRMILFGFKSELNYQYPDFKRNARKFDEINTLNAIGDLPNLQAGEGKDFNFTPYRENPNLSPYQQLMRENSQGVTNHKARKHSDRDLEIYKIAIKLAQGGKQLMYTDIPEEYRTHKNQKSFLDRFKVHAQYKTPHTIVAHIAKDGHYNIHPDLQQCRSLTVREAARIQSFPDNYLFEGPRTAQFTQVGNAVPPLMAEAIARSIWEDFGDGKLNIKE